MRRVALLVAIAACADRGSPTLLDAGASAATVVVPAAPDLFDLVPADAAYVVAVRDAMSAGVQQRLAWDVLPFVARLAIVAAERLDDHTIDDPVDRVEAALLAELPGPIGADTHAVLHELHGVPVLRIEVADADALEAALVRAWRRANITAAPVIEGAHQAITVSRAGPILTIAVGPAEMLREIAPMIAGAAPLDAPRLDPASVPGLGFVDLGLMLQHLRDTPEFEAWLQSDDATAPCRDATLDAFAFMRGHLPRVVLRAAAGDVDHVEVSAELAFDPAIAAALTTPATVTPGIPATFPGKPLVAFSFVAPPAVSNDAMSAAWTGAIAKVAEACGTGVKTAALPTAGEVRGLGFAFYDVTFGGWFPTDAQAYATVVAHDPLALLDDAAGTLKLLRGKHPKDGGPMLALSPKQLQPFVDSVAIGRRGESLVVAAGKQGRTYAEEALGATEPAPIIHLFLDVARMTKARPDDGAIPDGARMTDEADLGDLLSRLVSTLDVTITGAPAPALRIAAALTPVAVPPASGQPDPALAAVSTCQRLLARAWTSSSRSLTRMGITDLAPFEKRLLDGFGTSSFVQDCVALPDTVRACLRAAPDVLAAMRGCAPDLEPPELFDTVFDDGPHPMDVALGKGTTTMAQLAGTWVSTTYPDDRDERWTITAAGKATHGSSRYTLEILSDGKVELVTPDRWKTSGGFVLAGPDDLYLDMGLRAFPLPDEQHVVVGDSFGSDRWIVLDPQGCTMIDARGRTEEASCDFTDRDGKRWFEHPNTRYQVLAGHLVGEDLAAAHYRRAP